MKFYFNSESEKNKIADTSNVDALLRGFKECLVRFRDEYAIPARKRLVNFSDTIYNYEISPGRYMSQWINKDRDRRLFFLKFKGDFTVQESINGILDFVAMDPELRLLISLPTDGWTEVRIKNGAGKINNSYNDSSFFLHMNDTFPRYEYNPKHPKHDVPDDAYISPILATDEEAKTLLKNSIKLGSRRYAYDPEKRRKYVVFYRHKDNVFHGFHTNEVPPEVTSKFQSTVN